MKHINSLFLSRNIYVNFTRRNILNNSNKLVSQNNIRFFYVCPTSPFFAHNSNLIQTTAFKMNTDNTIKRNIQTSILLKGNQEKLKEKKKQSSKLDDLEDKFEDAVENISEKLEDGKKEVVKMDLKSRFKQIVRDYGSTAIIFHVCISLTSLGISYIFVSSGLDVVGWLKWVGLDGYMADSKVVAGGSTFLIAYAFHKVFAPARMACTIGATPFIVRFLRSKGILKKPIKK